MARPNLQRELHLKRCLLAALESEQDELDTRKKRVKAEIQDLEAQRDNWNLELRSDHELGEAA